MHPVRQLLISLSVSLCFFWAYLPAQTKSPGTRAPQRTSQLGRSTFNNSCAACHGLDGRGSDKGVNISGSARVKHLTDAQLSQLISEGIPGTGMPAFRTLGPGQLRAVVGYIRSLQGKSETETVSGDAKRGKEIFFGKGACSSCHTVSGEGGFMGPDLSGYGSIASATTIRDQIINPGKFPQPGFRAAVLTTAAGDRIEGLIRNEDNFSLQFQSKDGSFHFFQKSELRSIDRQETSLMPSDYGDRLSAGELSDLVAYLVSAGANAGKAGTSHKKESDYE
jgi:cytochrome c oxidase cbb3-type subunit III